jgi:glucose/arabinose dehydrogenase
MRKALCAASALVLAFATSASAQQPSAGNLEKLGEFKQTGTSMDMPTVPQTGAKAAAIKKTLARIKLPPGFKINLYAIVPDARHMAVGPQGVVMFVGTRKNKVWSVTDRDKDRVADEVKEFAPSIPFAIPNGVCFSKDGFLFIAEQNRVLVFPAAEFFYEGPDVAAFQVVKQGELIPPDEESYNHTARTCRIGPDDKLYITLGQPLNVFAPDKMELYKKTGIGGIVSMTREGKDRDVFAWGIRNSVGMDFNPKDKSLWFTDNQVDGMGDDIPAGELNRADKPGMNFGFPYYGGGKTRTNEYKNETPPADVTFPQVEMVAHAADLGMMFYSGKQFPAKYRGGIFSAQHGSWNRTVPVGARIMFTSLKDDGTAAKTEPFAEGG